MLQGAAKTEAAKVRQRWCCAHKVRRWWWCANKVRRRWWCMNKVRRQWRCAREVRQRWRCAMRLGNSGGVCMRWEDGGPVRTRPATCCCMVPAAAYNQGERVGIVSMHKVSHLLLQGISWSLPGVAPATAKGSALLLHVHVQGQQYVIKIMAASVYWGTPHQL